MAAVGVLGWSVVAAILVGLAANDLRQGKTLALRAKDGATATALRDGSLADDLGASARAFRRGAGRLQNPILAPLRVFPFIGRQQRSAVALAKGATVLSAAGARAAQEVAAAVDPPPTSGPGRLQALRRIGRASEVAMATLDTIPLGPATGLLGPLQQARDDLRWQLDSAGRDLQRGATITSAVGEFLGQERRYVLVAANNAEMRAGSGMFLSVGLLETGGGEMDLGEMFPTGSLVLPEGVPVEGDLAELWGWTEPGRDWRNLAMSPRFEASAPVAARLWEAQMGGEIDGVLAVDVAALRALLATTGPVGVGGETISADGVERRLLHDQYRGLSFDVASGGAQSERREELGGIARAVVDAVNAGRIDLPALADEMSKAAAGRHILAWSRRPSEQLGWESADISGKLAPDSLAVSLLNRGGNKLDPFMQVDTDVRSAPATGGGRSVELTIRLRNATPEGEPVYVAGPHPDQDVAPGTYVGLVAVNLPGAARSIDTGDAVAIVRGADGPTQSVAVAIALPRGEERTVTLSFDLPATTDRLVVEPSARIPPATFTSGRREFLDDRRVIIDLPS